MVSWDPPNERYYQHGLDRGVLYPRNIDAVAWNGLTDFDEGSDSPSTAMYYRDGIVYLADADASDFRGVVKCMFFPKEFSACLGMPEAADGLYVDNQKPQPFDLSYRTLIGSGGATDRFGYQIHLVYNCMASIAARQRRTIGKDTDPVEFSFDIVCTPVKLQGYRPTAHYVIDTRGMSANIIADLEAMLYGLSSAGPARMPEPQELYDLMNFGDAITFHVHPNGTYTVVASSDNIFALDDYHFQMNNVNGVANSDGTYVISDGGNTDVDIE